MNINFQQLVGVTVLAILLLGGLVLPSVQWIIYRFSTKERKNPEKNSIPQDISHVDIRKKGTDWMEYNDIYRREIILSQVPKEVDFAWFQQISSALPPNCSSSVTVGPNELFDEDPHDDLFVGDSLQSPKTNQLENETIYVSVCFTIIAQTKSELDQHTKWVEKVISSEGGSVKRIRGKYIEAIHNSGPLSTRHNQYQLEIPVNAAAALSFPAPASTYRDYTQQYDYTPDPTYLS